MPGYITASGSENLSTPPVQLTPLALMRILGQVTVILFVPIVGGALVGIALDRLLEIAPLGFLGGFVLGNVVSVVGIALLIRSGQRRLRGSGQPSTKADGDVR